MTDNQKRVTKYIQEDRSLRGAIEIYNTLPNKNLAFLGSINRMRATEENCKKAAYHLCKAVGIEERMLTILWNNKIQPASAQEDDAVKVVVIGAGSAGIASAAAQMAAGVGPTNLIERVMDFDPETAAWRDIQILASDISDVTKTEANGGKKVDLLPFIADFRSKVIGAIKNEIPVTVKESIKLRAQFPFLEDKSCPMELKALVNDLITTYHNYKKGHEKLFESMTLEEEQSLAAEIVKNFIENKEIFEELEHYKTTGELLGKHQIFEDKKIKSDLDQSSAEELRKKEQSLRTGISRKKTKIAAESDPEKKADLEKDLEQLSDLHDYVLSLIKKK